jgi:hypothetical protein
MIEGIDFLAQGARGCLARGYLHPDMVNEWWTRGRFLGRSGVPAKAHGWRIYGENDVRHCGNFVTKVAVKCGFIGGLRVLVRVRVRGGK